jgi:hypothetical protein
MTETAEISISKIRIDEHFANRLGEPSEKETARLTDDINMNGILMPLR